MTGSGPQPSRRKGRKTARAEEPAAGRTSANGSARAAPPRLPRCDRLILAAGMPRSGSTWLYNAIRLLCEAAGGEVSAGWIGDFGGDKGPACDDLVVKIHNADAKLAGRANFIFSSRRDLRDVGASIRDMGWAKSDKGVLRQVAKARRAHAFWAARSDLDVDYRDIVERPDALMERIAAILRIPLGAKALAEVAKEAAGLAADPSRMTSQHDALNLMHATHRFDGRPGGWRDRLSAELAAEIAEAHGDWLKLYGYLRAARAKPRKA